jgi:hypothetical protein
MKNQPHTAIWPEGKLVLHGVIYTTI